jgi:cell division transport system ATP-binding protein
MITFEYVTKRYGERLALDSVSWHMDEGECLSFVGPSGAGKTTLLRLITHEISPTSGTVTIGTFREPRLSRERRALLRRTVGIVYEDFRLLGDRSVFENVALAVRVNGRFDDAEVVPRTLYALEEVGLQQKQAAYPSELSAGERQRAAIARAIANRPAVLLADEPTGALESSSAREVVRLLRRVHEEGAALVTVTTRPEVGEALGGRILRLQEGRISGEVPAAPRRASPTPRPAPAPKGTSESPPSGSAGATPPAGA